MERGSYNEDKTVFVNEVMDITINIPQDWYTYSDDDVAQIFLGDVTGGELASWTQADFASRLTIPDMDMQDLFTGENLNLQYENLIVSTNGLDIDETQYAKLSQKQLNGLGFDYVYSDIKDVQLNGNDYKWFSATGSSEGVIFTQYFMVRRVDDYMIVMVATTYSENNEEYFFNMFPQ